MSSAHPFLAAFAAHCDALVDDCMRQTAASADGLKCLMCIPQSLSLLTAAISRTQLQTHFLLPDAQVGQYRSLNGKQIAVVGAHIHTKAGFHDARVVRILMTEEWPHRSLQVSLVHINRPLEGGVAVPDEMGEMDVKTFRRYIALMRAYPESESVFASLDYFVHQVQRLPPSHPAFGPENLGRVWQQSTALLLENGTLDLGPRTHQRSLQLDQAVESYLLEQVHAKVLHRLEATCVADQAKLEAAWFALRNATPSTFKIRREYQCQHKEAIALLLSAYNQTTPLGMLLQLKRVLQSVQDAIHARLIRHKWPLGEFHLSTDDVLDQLIYILVRAGITSDGRFPFAAMLQYMEQYHFVPATVSAIGFTMANFQVALEWLLTSTMTTSHNELSLTALAAQPEGDRSMRTTEDTPSVLHVSGRIDPIPVEGCVYHVAVGHRCFASVSDSGAVATWGDAYGGRLGYPQAINHVEMPQRVVGVTKVLQVACGSFHMLACDINGHVFAWGTNAVGQLGLPSATVPMSITPRRIEDGLQGAYISAVACGDAHSLAMSSQGAVFSWGCNRFFQLGRETTIGNDAASRPSPVESAWSTQSTLATAVSASASLKEASNGASSVSAETREPGAALRIAAGAHHSMVLSRDGTLFAWGCGSDGRLGIGSEMDVPSPLRVVLPPGAKPVDVGGGAAYTCVLLKSGHVLLAGLVCPDMPNVQHWLTPLDVPAVVRTMACGANHIVWTLADGSIWGWGSNVHRQCDLMGSGTHATILEEPRVLAAAEETVRVLQVAAGASHTIAVTQAVTTE
ncbi:hypothetical protein SDRG_14220 [Saprolegnia diclina VS20]|uniref:VPS9 domain-containing protein n=1 Tax=Saprolegnia diclina (strain VS20) TaxID=1156394 RepID=T0REC7_SAPDV|nr:hypothetical protein SDRG_14220 [Saprolegnia diclina VS20]EQC27942.1 hypothetical protein SDRG_14220 [Saprolegnia diclina VS20]|eukprot:XP_008618555.1 hypothetical protein SDRG_14220 [Saprolegnia diclina VS20]